MDERKPPLARGSGCARGPAATGCGSGRSSPCAVRTAGASRSTRPPIWTAPTSPRPVPRPGGARAGRRRRDRVRPAGDGEHARRGLVAARRRPGVRREGVPRARPPGAGHPRLEPADGEHRVNEQYPPGPVWRGFPVPTTDAEKLLELPGATWISRAEFVPRCWTAKCWCRCSARRAAVRPVPVPGGHEVIAYSSSAKVPGRYPHRWRVSVRELLAGRRRPG